MSVGKSKINYYKDMFCWITMLNIKSISDLRNYTEFTCEVQYVNRVYLYRNGNVLYDIIDTKELDELDKQKDNL